MQSILRVCMYVCACVSLQHCDKAIARYYPDLFNKAEEAKGTFINALIFTSDSVAVVKSERTTWIVTMDRSMVWACVIQQRNQFFHVSDL